MWNFSHLHHETPNEDSVEGGMLQDVAKEFGASTTFYVYPALSLILSTSIKHVYILPVS